MFAMGLMNMFCTECSIICFYKFPIVFVQKLKALLQGHRMRVHFPNIFYFNAGIYKEVLTNMQVYLSNNFKTAFLQQIVIRQNTSCNRILNGHYSAITFFFVGRNFYYIAEISTRNY